MSFIGSGAAYAAGADFVSRDFLGYLRTWLTWPGRGWLSAFYGLFRSCAFDWSGLRKRAGRRCGVSGRGCFRAGSLRGAG